MRFQDFLHSPLLFKQNKYSLPWSQDPLTTIFFAGVMLRTVVTRPPSPLSPGWRKFSTMVTRPSHSYIISRSKVKYHGNKIPSLLSLGKRKLSTMVTKLHSFCTFSRNKVKDHGHKTPLILSSVKGRFSTTVTRPHQIYPQETEPKRKFHIVLHAILIL